MTHVRPKPPTERTPEWLIGLLIAIVLVTVGWFFLRSIGAGDDPVLGDRSAPEASGALEGEFVLFDGTPMSFDSLDGPLVVIFWDSSCVACLAELENIQSVSEELGDAVTFVAMNVLPDDRGAAEALIAAAGVEFQVAQDDGGAIYDEVGGVTVPTTVFVEPDGTMVEVHSGTLGEAGLRERIGELLGV